MPMRTYHFDGNSFRMNVHNMTKLGSYLYSLPRNYKDFEMSQFARVQDYEKLAKAFNLDFDDSYDFISSPITSKETDIESNANVIPLNCGTAACAVGHGPNAGIKPKKGEEWGDYSYRTLIDSVSDCEHVDGNIAWEWCFSGEWSEYDNHHWGAARRINYLIKHKRVPGWFNVEFYFDVKHYINFKKSNRIWG